MKISCIFVVIVILIAQNCGQVHSFFYDLFHTVNDFQSTVTNRFKSFFESFSRQTSVTCSCSCYCNAPNTSPNMVYNQSSNMSDKMNSMVINESGSLNLTNNTIADEDSGQPVPLSWSIDDNVAAFFPIPGLRLEETEDGEYILKSASEFVPGILSPPFFNMTNNVSSIKQLGPFSVKNTGFLPIASNDEI